MKELGNINPERQMFVWWSKIRWFIVIVLFAIGILRTNQVQQTYPVIVFIATFLGISILNILYQLQILKTNNLIGAIQVILDIVFATLVVHLTGGLNSSFVWIYLLAVITASLSIEGYGGFLSAIIGSLCLVFLILIYNFGWLIPLDSMDNANTADQTVFILSYTGLFTGIAFISSHISAILKKLFRASLENEQFVQERDQEISKKQEILIRNSSLLSEYQKVVDLAANIANIDHDINNPLTVISLSIRKIMKTAKKYQDEKLEKAGTQMTEAINHITKILKQLKKLRDLSLIQDRLQKEEKV